MDEKNPGKKNKCEDETQRMTGRKSECRAGEALTPGIGIANAEQENRKHRE